MEPSSHTGPVDAIRGEERGPLAGHLVVDLSRMLPGAVVVRQLVDLGARVIKVEPKAGDPMRLVPPMVGSVGAGFAVFFRGVESVCLALDQDEDRRILWRMIERADVVPTSFRPSTMEKWGLAPKVMAAKNPSLIVCSLSGYPTIGPHADEPGHDLNFVARSGALTAMRSSGVPLIQLADVSAGLMAVSSILAALLVRARTGLGAIIEQPLSSGSIPFLLWAMADRAAGGGAGLVDEILGGVCPGYRIYDCADGRQVSVATVEMKFWNELMGIMGLDELRGQGMVTGSEAERVAMLVQRRFSNESAAVWLERTARQKLPVTLVTDLDETVRLGYEGLVARTERLGLAGEGLVPGSWLALGRSPGRRAPTLGQDQDRILEEFNGVGQARNA